MLESPTYTLLGPDDAGLLLSAEEFAQADYQDPYRYERVKGRLVIMAPSGDDHRSVVNPVLRKLMHYWELHPEIVADVDAEGWVATSPDDDRIPDIAKREEYERIGVKEYVIIDRLKKTALVLSLVHRKYAEQILGRTDSYTTPLLPGLVVELRGVLSEG